MGDEFSGCAFVYPNGDICGWDEWWHKHFDSNGVHEFVPQIDPGELSEDEYQRIFGMPEPEA